MTYSAKLDRHIHVSIENLNNFDIAEFEAASHRFYDTGSDEIRMLAANGDLDAQYLVNEAKCDGYVAGLCKDLVG